MEAKHTKGPWELRDEFGRQGLVYPVGSEYPVAAVTGYYSSVGQSKHNARLIAAAPDLLEALIELAEAGEDAWGADRPCVRIAKQAIAKAAQ